MNIKRPGKDNKSYKKILNNKNSDIQDIKEYSTIQK